MNSPVLDQDNVFAEPASAFDGATPAPASRGRAKTVKKSGGIPIWLWATSGVVVLLVTFVVFRMISGQRESNHLEPITQAPAALAPIEQVPAADLVAADADPSPHVAQPEAEQELLIPGDEPVVPGEVPAEVSQAPGLAPVDVPALAPSPSAADPVVAPAPAAVEAAVDDPKEDATKVVDENAALRQRVDALTGEVARLERLVKSTPRPQAASRPQASRKAAPDAPNTSPSPAQPAPIVGLTLKAIVDTSAWLQTESGETVMVQPGDLIHGVGTVKAVDPEAGTVRMNDGRVLR